MYFVKDNPKITIHNSSGTNWEIINAKDTRPISEIPITEFVKSQQHFWKPGEINLTDDEIDEFTRNHKKFITHVEAFRTMMMGGWFAGKDNPDRRALPDVAIGPSHFGKNVHMKVAKNISLMTLEN